MLVERFRVNSPNVQYGEDSITTSYSYDSTDLEQTQSGWVATPTSTEYTFRTGTKLPKLGRAPLAAGWLPAAAGPPAERAPLPCRVMLVGWGGNNGSTLTASVLANKKCGPHELRLPELMPPAWEQGAGAQPGMRRRRSAFRSLFRGPYS